jgi:transposase
MDRPQEIEVVEEHEIVERVAAIDVAKATGMVCTRVPHASIEAKRVTKVFEVHSTTKGITELAEHLVKERIERVVLESTSDYWRPFFYVLEGAGLTVWLVNARQVRNVPGRPEKTCSTRSGWRSSPSARCSARASCPRSRCATCAISPAHASTSSRTAAA